ncbi:MAG: DUF2232 domain-containing protein [Clostridia bacterium]
MNHKFNIKRLLETAYLTGITVILVIIGYYIPAWMTYTVFLSTIPLVIITVRNNEKTAVLSAFIAYFFILLLTNEIVFASITAMRFSFPGLVLGYGMKRRWDFQKVLISSSGAYLFSLLLIIFIISNMKGVNQIDAMIGQYLNDFDRSVEEMNKVFKDVQISTDNLKVFKDLFTYLIPGFFIISSAFFGFIALNLSKALLTRFGYDYKHMPAFSELGVNRETTFVFLVSFVLSMLITSIPFSAAFANISLILAMIFMVCGVSILDFFLKKKGIPGLIRTILYMIGLGVMVIIAVVIPILHPIYVLIVLTLMDSTLDFRKLKHKGEKHG